MPRLTRAWYVLCMSSELGASPIRRTLFGQPLVLFRDAEGQPGALVDRCPHRNVPLSAGTVTDGRLACAYHGWQFDRDGTCTHVPALVGQANSPARRCGAYPVQEQQGFVWVWADRDHPAEGLPHSFRMDGAEGYLSIRRRVEAKGSVHAVAENALDVPHTAFAHAGLFRQDKDRQKIEVRLTRNHDRVEAEYIGESRPEGLVGWILSPSGGEVTHFDRFMLPSIVEVEYRIGSENHIVTSAALTPIDDHHTALFALVCVRTRVPIRLVRPIVEPLAMRIFGQDQEILAMQSQTMAAFGEARFASTELDVLGPHILRLMRQAARRELDPAEAAPYTKTSEMMV